MGSTQVIAWFADIGLVDRPHVGGKGGSLGELQRAGIAVPAGFVIKTGAFERFIAALSGDDLAATAAECEQIRARIEAELMPPDVLDELASAHAGLCGHSGG